MSTPQSGLGLASYFGNTVLTLLPANMFHYSMILLSSAYVESPSFAGIVFFCTFVPIGLLTPIAGRALDLKNRKALVVLGQATSLVALAGLALLMSVQVNEDLRPAIMIALAIIMGSSLAFVVPARLTFLADIADEEKLPGATAMTALLTLVGFGLAPVTVDFVKSQVDWVGLGVAIVALHVLGMILLTGARAHRVREVHTGPTGSFRSYLSENPLVLQALIAVALIFTAMGPLQVLLPRYFVDSLGATELQRGMIISWLGGGLLIGALASQIWVTRTRRFGLGVLLAGMGLGVATGAIALASNTSIGGLLLAASGLALGFSSTSVSVLLQQFAGDEHRGQTMAAFSMVFQLIPAIFALLAGFVASVTSVPTALALSGSLIVLGLGGVFLLSRPFKNLGSLKEG